MTKKQSKKDKVAEKPKKRISFLAQVFIEAYTGNTKETVRWMQAQGIQISDSYGVQLLKRPHIKEALENRRGTDEKFFPKRTALIANRQERQIWWTSLMFDENQFIDVRMRASENLAKCEGDFIQKIEDNRGKHEDFIKQLIEDEKKDSVDLDFLE